ncbi:PaaX family transcriptional regulator C-terminal domain-containing protein [Microbacter sp. GSS18]|nr:PaaX family transcriptional regulator C-terminal domain-containing protein [Microbacter sp. GSS18]
MADILDDLDSRPGSTTSLLRTIIGVYLRELGGWIAVADLLVLLDALEVPPPRARTAIARLKKKEILIPEARDRVIGYRLAADAVPMLESGDRRIYHPRAMDLDSEWCLVSFSIPEEERHLRHQLRRRLHWIGCGTVSQALWIAPAYLVDEVEDILVDLAVRDRATVFVAHRPRVAGDLADAVAHWWDLDAIRSYYDTFITEHAHQVEADDIPGREAFARYVRSIDTWRIIPYIDPGLPRELLPHDWPGEEGSRLMLHLRDRYRAPAADFVSTVTGTGLGSHIREGSGATPEPLPSGP